jgi:hypothetical protein
MFDEKAYGAFGILQCSRVRIPFSDDCPTCEAEGIAKIPVLVALNDNLDCSHQCLFLCIKFSVSPGQMPSVKGETRKKRLTVQSEQEIVNGES